MSLIKLAAAKWREVAKNLLKKEPSQLAAHEAKFLKQMSNNTDFLSADPLGKVQHKLMVKATRKFRDTPSEALNHASDAHLHAKSLFVHDPSRYYKYRKNPGKRSDHLVQRLHDRNDPVNPNRNLFY